MAFLALNGVDIPIMREPVGNEPTVVGDEAEAFDGTYLTRRRGYKERYGPFRTKPLNGADITNFRTLFRAAPPLAATGDLTGAKSVIVVELRETTITLQGLSRWTSFEFVLREE